MRRVTLIVRLRIKRVSIYVSTRANAFPRQVPRFMTKTCLLDYDSIAGADKFGNIFVLRVPTDVSDDVDNPTGVSCPHSSSRGLQHRSVDELVNP